MAQIKRIVFQSLLVWCVLIVMDLLSSIFSMMGLLNNNILDVLDGFWGIAQFTGLFAIIQGGIIGFKKKYSITILPLLILLIQLDLIITMKVSQDPYLPSMAYELLSLLGFAVCPYSEILYKLVGPFSLTSPLSANQLIWCFQYTFFIGLYVFVILLVTKKILLFMGIINK